MDRGEQNSNCSLSERAPAVVYSPLAGWTESVKRLSGGAGGAVAGLETVQGSYLHGSRQSSLPCSAETFLIRDSARIPASPQLDSRTGRQRSLEVTQHHIPHTTYTYSQQGEQILFQRRFQL